MDASDYLRVAAEEFEAARRAAQGSIGFAETASAVRSHTRSATACLTGYAVLVARQQHFDWDTPPRGDQPTAVPTA